ncbi:hypothetical protein [Pseudoruegeria sp. HB172150]|uniref:hypothetical protein n=1 Tax=Pseudoruegeria sp. HB172150 TaxID=2721164 RepID=UPI001C12F82E|nr:hypothetical protein [Pseudoruegeria sp. HB172150]
MDSVPPTRCDGTSPLPAELKNSVMLLGSFDGFHRGHQALLAAGRKEAKRLGVPLSILQFDPHPRVFFAGETEFRLVAGAARDLLVAQYGFELVFAPLFDARFANLEPEDFVGLYLVKHLAVSGVIAGPDFRFGRARKGNASLLSELGARHGFQVQIADEVRHGTVRVSSSAIRTAIRSGRLDCAEKLLGRAWTTGLPSTVSGCCFPPEQVLPPPGQWHVTYMDRTGRSLRDGFLYLAEGRRVRLDAPDGTAMVRWNCASQIG